ncbi:MAG: alpha/beta fold hydrolase [Clostridia bacterium]|nr:alpha/beta fold hydrolase [Clostridia bacterium]
MREISFPSATGVCDSHGYIWPCESPRAVLQIVHGMSEYMLRYDEFARFLNTHGIVVAGIDNASHGKSRKAEAAKGYFGPETGWDNLLADIHTMRKRIEAAYTELPILLLGHSMGSFLARSYAARHGEGIYAFIFMGTAGPNPVLALGKRLAEREIRKTGGGLPSPSLAKLATGSYNSPFQPSRTDFDWLSRDMERVDAYVADEDCGFPFTAAGYRDLFQGLMEISKKNWASSVPNVPILLLSGLDDPVGGKEAGGVKIVADRLVQTGHDVELHLYAHARHELLNETNREDVMQDILSFVDKALEKA